MRRRINILLTVLCCTFSGQIWSQCELFDFYGNPSNTPYWYQCTGTDYTLNIQSPNTLGAWTIDWGDGSPIQSGTDLVPPSSITHLYTAAVDTFVVTFTETSTGCVTQGVMVMEEATSASIQIPVGGLTQACAPQAMEFINSSTNVSENTIFTWDFGDGSPNEVYDHTNWGQTISHTYQENTVDCETVVTLTAENYCNTLQGGNSTATFDPIRIWDYDDAAITPSATVLCWPDNTVEYMNTSEMNCYAQGNIAQRYEYWNFGDYWGLGYDSIVDWTPWPPTFPYTLEYPAIGTYEVTLLDSNFCGIDAVTIAIEIVPPPTSNITTNLDTVCVGEAITFFNNSSPEANAWQINYGDGTGWQAIGNGPVTYLYNAAGDYQIGLVALVAGAGASCTDTSWVDVHVKPGPIADILIGTAGACGSLTTTVDDNSTGAIDWQWDFGNSNTFSGQSPPDQSYDQVGVHEISLSVIASNGCVDEYTASVEVYDIPDAQFVAAGGCLGDTATFIDQSMVSFSDPIVSWDWYFGDGSTSILPSPEHLFQTGGTFDVQLIINTANCSDDTTITVAIDDPPTSDFTADITSGCSPLEVSFTNNSSGGNSYIWYLGDGSLSSDTNVVHSYVNSSMTDTTYTLSLVTTDSAGCTDTSSMDINVVPQTIAAFQSNAMPACAPYEATFNNTSLNASSYEWDFGDGSANSNDVHPTHLYENQTEFIQNYTATLIAYSANGCHDTITALVTAYPEPDFSFDLAPYSGCAPLETTMPIIPSAVSYDWDFGDGNNGSGVAPMHTYQNNGTSVVNYSVELIASNAFGCIDTAYSAIDVYPSPLAQATANVTEGCSPLDIQFANQSLLMDSAYWVFALGDTTFSTSLSVSHEFINEGVSSETTEVQLLVSSIHGCVSTTTVPITVHPKPIAKFTGLMEGCSPLSVAFQNQSTGATDFNWDFGDGIFDIAQNPDHTFYNYGIEDEYFQVQMIASSAHGCQDTAVTQVLVYPLPDAEFTVNPVIQTYPNTTVTINDFSVAGSATYLWEMGDGNTSTDTTITSHTYTSWGTYELSLTIDNGHCSDQSIQIVEILASPPIAAFVGQEDGCAPVTIEFENLSTGASQFLWNFGDGGTSTNESPTYTFFIPGAYTVSLLATGPGGNDIVVSDTVINVYPNANAYFTVNPPVISTGDPVFFYNLSVNADDFEWDFGDGNNSSEHSPINHYQDIGTYPVTLIANNQYNCPDTFQVSEAVLVDVGGYIEFPNAFTPSPTTASDGSYDPSMLDNDVFHPVFAGVDEYELQIYNRWGELLFESNEVSRGWNGQYRGGPAQQGVYVWRAKIKFTDGKQKILAGDVTLLR